MILGVDVGYSHTKDSNQNIFKSAYATNEPILNDGYKININGVNYWCGTGIGTIELDKANSILNKVCLLTCLMLSSSSDFNIVTGLPVAQFKQHKEKLRETVLNYNNSIIRLNEGSEKRIRINDVMVFPQGAGALYSQSINKDVIIVDLGSRTIDVSLIENGEKAKLLQYNTYFSGMMILYGKIIDVINRKFELTLKPSDGEKILSKGLEILGVNQDLSILQPVLQSHFEEIFTDLKLNYPVMTTPIYLCGGGVYLLFNAFKKRFSNVKFFDNYQFSNANGFYQIGLRTWGKECH